MARKKKLNYAHEKELSPEEFEEILYARSGGGDNIEPVVILGVLVGLFVVFTFFSKARS